MKVYIDESGSFSGWGKGICSPDVVCCLVIPDASFTKFLDKFARLKKRWGGENKEIKGSSLTDIQVLELAGILLRCECIVQAVIIDSGATTLDVVEGHKRTQAKCLTAALDHRHSREIRKWLHEQRQYFRAMPNNLYAQMQAVFRTLSRAVQIALIEFPFSRPEELGSFTWVVDAKDKDITNFEKTWSQLVFGIIQSQSFSVPLIFCEDADYSHFDKSYRRNEPTPEYLVESGIDRRDEWVDLGALYKNLAFKNSEKELGLQAVDMIASSLRKALRGKLGDDAIKAVGRLFFAEKEGPLTVLSFGSLMNIPVPYLRAFKMINQSGRPISLHFAKD